MNKACYTCIFGHYEELKDPTVPQTDFDFICFTDQPLVSNVWRIIQITPDETPQRMARKIKLLPHIYLPEYEHTFWLDASFKINIDLNTFWNKYFKQPLSVPSHPIRTCVYREIESCIVNKRGDEDELRRQGEAYKGKVPPFEGIITSGVLMRQKTIECVNLCNEWWEELKQHSARDQVAFAKVCRTYVHHTFVWDYSQSKELKYIQHFKYRQNR